MAENGDVVLALLVFVGEERPAEHRLDAEYVEVMRRDLRASKLYGFIDPR